MTDERWFEQLAEMADADDLDTGARAPARLKSKIYSAMVSRMVEAGPLLDLQKIKGTGGRLCVFENLLTVLPAGTGLPATNPCRICHARVLGERMEHAPIFWPACPYSEFHRS